MRETWVEDIKAFLVQFCSFSEFDIILKQNHISNVYKAQSQVLLLRNMEVQYEKIIPTKRNQDLLKTQVIPDLELK